MKASMLYMHSTHKHMDEQTQAVRIRIPQGHVSALKAGILPPFEAHPRETLCRSSQHRWDVSSGTLPALQSHSLEAHLKIPCLPVLSARQLLRFVDYV